jgi:uncharacterized membrane protein
MLTGSLFTRLRHSRPLQFFVVLFFLFFSSCHALTAQQPPAPPNGKSSFTVRLMNIEAATNETFRYNATLHNGSAKTVVYELTATMPDGWMVAYKVDGNRITSLNLDAAKSQDISIEINAAVNAKPGKYKIPVKAVSGTDTLLLEIEAVVKGSYGLELTTPTGRLSEEVTSGSHEEIHLVAKNSGTLVLSDIELSSQLPPKWECSFEPAKIQQLEPGKSVDIIARLNVPDKTIAGDYASTFTIRNANTNAQAAFRIIVKTSLLSGWIGILVILLAIGLVYYLIRKYGRR